MPNECNEFVSIRRDRLLAGAALVPPDQRALFFARLLIGLDGISPGVGDSAVAISEGASPPSAEPARSFPISIEQARELRDRVNSATWAVIEAVVADPDKDGVGVVEWSEAKRLTGAKTWPQFAQGRMGGLHRSLHKIAGVPPKAKLLWEAPEGWVEDGHGDYSTGSVRIDGPAVRTLRAVCGFRD